MTSLATQPSQASEADRPAVVRLRGLRKAYFKPDGSVMVEALRGVDLEIRHGEYVAVMGASGSGKSTLMNVLGCLDRPSDGEYLLDGRDVATMSDEELSSYRGRKIGFVFQAFNLISELTVQGNVEVPLMYQGVVGVERSRRAAVVLDQVGLGDRMHHRPRELSGGQQQRAAIARALVVEPVVLMADEPTGNLDSATGEAILRLFEALRERGMTIIVVTHDPKIGARARRVITLADGLIESDVRQG